jgi:hypothetical protein
VAATTVTSAQQRPVGALVSLDEITGGSNDLDRHERNAADELRRKPLAADTTSSDSGTPIRWGLCQGNPGRRASVRQLAVREQRADKFKYW